MKPPQTGIRYHCPWLISSKVVMGGGVVILCGGGCISEPSIYFLKAQPPYIVWSTNEERIINKVQDLELGSLSYSSIFFLVI